MFLKLCLVDPLNRIDLYTVHCLVQCFILFIYFLDEGVFVGNVMCVLLELNLGRGTKQTRW